MEDLQARVEALEKAHTDALGKLDALQQMMKENTEVTTQIKEIVELGRAFFNLAKYIGVMARWVLYVGASVGGIWAWLTHGANPFGGK
jgi:hypothetical protein